MEKNIKEKIMRIFDYDKFMKRTHCGRDGFQNQCKNHRLVKGNVIGDSGLGFLSDNAWESEVPDFMVGDRVVIKTWEQMKTEYGIDEYETIKCKKSFVKRMRNLCGKKATITRKDEEQIWLTFDDINADNGWSFSTDMIELAYPTVRGNDKEKKEVKTCKFKVGDIIIGNDKNGYAYTAKGIKCKVIGFLENADEWHDIEVKVLSTNEKYPVHSKYFDLVETPKVTYTADTVEYNGQKATCQSGDRFDLEKGIMLCLLKEKGIGYREIQELAKTAERKINHKFNIGDIVKVINAGKQYDSYFDWFNEQKKPELKKRYFSKWLLNGKELRVVHFGEHSYFTSTIIYACEDLKGNIYLIGERGLEKVED